jgi:hypothetical protein
MVGQLGYFLVCNFNLCVIMIRYFFVHTVVCSTLIFLFVLLPARLFLFGASHPVTQLEKQDKNTVGTITVSGIVRSTIEREVVIGASIRVYLLGYAQASPRAFAGTVSNKFGYFSMIVPIRDSANVSAYANGVHAKNLNNRVASFIITIRAIGYEEQSDTIALSTLPTHLRKIVYLNHIASTTQTVMVEADRMAVSPAISMVSLRREVVKSMPAVFGGESDPLRVLQLMPGIKSSSEVSGGLYIRGGTPDQNLVLLDGVPVYNALHLGGMMSIFHPDAVNDIRVYKGAFPAEYGGRLSGVVDMTLNEGRRDRIAGSVGLSFLNARGSLEGGLGNNGSFLITGRRMWLGDILSLVATDAPRYSLYDITLKSNYDISDRHRVYVSGYTGFDDLGTPRNPGVDDNIGISWGNDLLNARWSAIWDDQFFTSVNASYTRYRYTSGFGQLSEVSSNSFIRDYVFKADLTYTGLLLHTIKAGMDITHHNLYSDFKEYTQSVSTTFAQDKTHLMEFGAYIQDEFIPYTGVNIIAGLRYMQYGPQGFVEPRLSMSVNIDESLTARAGFGRHSQGIQSFSPAAQAMPADSWALSTGGLLPATSSQYVLGLEYKDPLLAVIIEGYYKTVQGIYEYRDGALRRQQQLQIKDLVTPANGTAKGIEVMVEKRAGSVRGWIGYTWSWVDRQSDILNNGNAFFPRQDKRHDLSIALTYEISPRWELSCTFSLASGQPITLPSAVLLWNTSNNPITNLTTNLPSIDLGIPDQPTLLYEERSNARMGMFHKADINLAYKFRWYSADCSLYFNVYNVYNRTNPFIWTLGDRSGYAQNMNTIRGTPPTAPRTFDVFYALQTRQINLFPILPSIGLSLKF